MKKLLPLALCFFTTVAVLAQNETGSPRVRRNALLNEVPSEIAAGANDKAIDDLEKAQMLGLSQKQRREWLPVLADLYVKENRYDKALPILHAALDADPGNWRRHLALGLACYQVGLKDEAITSLENTLDLQEDSTEALLPLGELYLKKGFLDDAEKSLQELLKLDPKSVEGHLTLAEVYEKGGQLPKSLEQLDQAAALSPTSPIYFKIGLLNAYQKQTEASLAAYKKGQALELKNGDYEFYAGLTYWIQNDWGKTEKFMTQAIDKGQTGGLPYFFRSLAYYHQGMKSAAHEDALRARSLSQGKFLTELSEDILHGT